MNYQYQQPLITGNTEGTPINLLRNDIQQKDDDSHYSVGSIDTTTDIRNLVNEINNNITNKKGKKTKNNDKDNNINDNVDNIDNNDNNDNIHNIDDNNNEKKSTKINNKKKSKKNIHICNVPMEDYLYDFILLFVIFMLMSQDFVKNFIGTYLKIINVNEKGIVPVSGVAVYGIIFVTVFILSKIFINKISEI
jgi:hypothetical protein